MGFLINRWNFLLNHRFCAPFWLADEMILSDAIALSVHYDPFLPIYVEDSVLEEVGDVMVGC